MHDTVIRGGLVVDGSGGAPFTADVAIDGDRIVEIGKIAAPARQVIDADGAVVTPGFLDVHTHYDGQFLWDETIDPSFSHGVTTVVAGNCGVGFAPVRAEHRRELMELMEGVEDIPGVVLDEGLDWDWKSFPDYLQRIAPRRFGLDVASQLTHAPLRVFVMGERALRHEAATPEDVEAMCGLVREAMAAGAAGVSVARFVEHRSSRGKQVPGTFAHEDELLALAKAMGESGHGVFQVATRGSIGDLYTDNGGRDGREREMALLAQMGRAAGRPVTFSVLEFASDPDDFRATVDASDRANASGLRLHPQIAPRSPGMMSMLDGYHVFLLRPSYQTIAHLPVGERVVAMRVPERRAAILAEADDERFYADEPVGRHTIRRMQITLPDSFVPRSPLDYEPEPERRLGVLAAAAGKTPEAYIYDHYVSGAGEKFNVAFALNYVRGSLDSTGDLLRRPYVVSGLADGGAHMRTICDASMPTFQLAFWSRARTRGERLPLEMNVRKLTGAAAALYGLTDRGVLAVGKRADINVIDFERLTPTAPYMAHDLPSGGPRMLQGSEGYLATLLAGVTTRRFDKDTGARPGRLLRLNAAV